MRDSSNILFENIVSTLERRPRWQIGGRVMSGSIRWRVDLSEDLSKRRRAREICWASQSSRFSLCARWSDSNHVKEKSQAPVHATLLIGVRSERTSLFRPHLGMQEAAE